MLQLLSADDDGDDTNKNSSISSSISSSTLCSEKNTHSRFFRQRLWLRLGVNVDDQLWLRLNPIPIPNCNPIFDRWSDGLEFAA